MGLLPIGECPASPRGNTFLPRGGRMPGRAAALAHPLHDSGIMAPKTLWVIVGIAIIIALLFAGFLPLPGQKDNETPLTEPAPQGKSLAPAQSGAR